MTREDKTQWDVLRSRKEECDRQIADLEKLLADEPDHPYRDQVLQDIKHEKNIRAIIAKAIPD